MFTKTSTPASIAAFSTFMRADDVGLVRLHRILLEQWEVLERCRMEHHLWAPLQEQSSNHRSVTDVGEDRLGRVEQRLPVDDQLRRRAARSRRGRASSARPA